MGILGVGCGSILWWFVTYGEPEERHILPSQGLSLPAETIATFPSLWFDRAAYPQPVDHAAAAVAGVPSGRLVECLWCALRLLPLRVKAFFMPVTVFGRYIPVAAC